jgi:peptidoglycan/LPS O-acetylase OafA/YrhL
MLGVWLYHSKQGLDYGYLGVDIFFVISGFLAYRSLMSAESGWSYLKSRLARLYPALIFSLLLFTPIFVLISVPDDLKRYSSHAMASLLFVSNQLLQKEINYFGPGSEQAALLHTWSLSVEVQFYIVAAILGGITTGRTTRFRLVVFCLGILSFFYMLSLLPQNIGDAFFRGASRFWEFAAGMLVASMAAEDQGRIGMQRALYYPHLMFGVIGIFILMLLPLSVNGHPSPNLGFFIIAISTFLYFCVRLESFSGTHTTPILIDLLGRATYPFYLLHYPALVAIDAWGVYFPGRNLLLFFGIVLLSYFCLRYVERLKLTRIVFFGTLLALSSIFVVIYFFDGFAKIKYTPENQKMLLTGVIGENRERCHTGGENYFSPTKSCVWGQGDRKVVVVGDSHGVELSFALSKILPKQEYSLRQLTFSGCNPASYLTTDDKKDSCKDWLREVARFLRTESPFLVIYTFRYPQYINLSGIKSVEAGLKKLLEDVGHREILVWGLPELPDTPARLLYRRQDSTDHGTFAPSDSFELVAELISRINAIDLNIRPLFCGRPSSCKYYDQGHLMFFDTHHPSVYGAGKIANSIHTHLGLLK